MKCGSFECTDQTDGLAEWPGQPTMLCERCMRRAQRVAAVMGFQLVLIEMPPPIGKFVGAECLSLPLAMGLSVLPHDWCTVTVTANKVTVRWHRSTQAPRMIQEHLEALGFERKRYTDDTYVIDRVNA